MKTKNIFTIFFIIALTSIVLPFALRNSTETTNDVLSTIATLISSLAGVFTLILAILLFNKFGIETPLLEKNSATVFDFIDELKKSQLSVIGDGYLLTIQLHDPHQSLLSGPFPENWFYKDSLIFSENYNSSLERLFEIANSPFMPKSISEKG